MSLPVRHEPHLTPGPRGEASASASTLSSRGTASLDRCRSHPSIRSSRRALSPARSPTRCRTTSARGRSCRSGWGGARHVASSSRSASRHRRGSSSPRPERCSTRSRPCSSTSRSGSPTTTGRPRPVRSSSSRPCGGSRAASGRRRPSGSRFRGGSTGRAHARAGDGDRADRRGPRRSVARPTCCSSGRPGAARPRSTSRPATRRSRAVAARSCSCPRSRSRRRRSAGSAQRFGDTRCDPPLGARAGRAPRRARSDRPRRGADRRRRALGDLRPDARPRARDRRRGARLVVQAGVGSPLRRADGRRQAGSARGRGRRLRKRDAAAGELGHARARHPLVAHRRADAAGARRRPSARAGLPALRAAPDRARPDRRARRQGDPPAQPARRHAGAPLPGLRALAPLRRAATSP